MEKESLKNSVDLMNLIVSPQFNKYFKQKLYPYLLRYDNKRKTNLTIASVLASAAIIMVALVLFFFYAGFELLNENLRGILFVVAFCFFIASVLIVTNYKKTIKKEMLPKLLNFLGSDFASLECPVSLRDEVEKTELFDYFNRFHADDYITGVYKGKKIYISELCLEYHKSSGKNSSTRTVFNGLFVKYPMEKKFSCKLILKTNGIYSKIRNPSGCKRVNLEDPVFEKHFDAFSDDQIEARYILTTSFMERLIKAVKRSKCDLSCCFKNGSIYLAVHTLKDNFEFPITSSPADIKVSHRIMLDLAEVFALIDVLKIDVHTGL